MSSTENNSLIVQIVRVCFQKPDSKWSILECSLVATGEGTASPAAKNVKCTGVVAFDVQEGAMLKLEGYWKQTEYGPEFSFRSCISHLPTDPAALLHYAVSITKGLGQAREAQIWAKYGAAWLTAETLDIDGINEKVAFAWTDTLRKINENAAQTQAASFLMSRGCTLNMANVAWVKWAENTIGTVQADPYSLAELPHYGFKTVDATIRPFFDIADSDPRRVLAAVMYCAGELTANGDTIISSEQLYASVAALVPCSKEMFDATCETLEGLSRLLPLSDDTFSLADDWQNESKIFGRFER